MDRGVRPEPKPPRHCHRKEQPRRLVRCIGDGNNERLFEIEGTGPFFYLNVQSGFDRNLPTQPQRSGLEIHGEYTDASGQTVENFTQGQEVTVHLRIRSLKSLRITNVAIVDLLPGGFEVIRSSVPRTVGRWRADYVDVREDRVIFYGNYDKDRILEA